MQDSVSQRVQCEMQPRREKADAAPRLQLFNCMHADCGATFTRKWRLDEHESVHTGEVSRPTLEQHSKPVCSVFTSAVFWQRVQPRCDYCGKDGSLTVLWSREWFCRTLFGDIENHLKKKKGTIWKHNTFSINLNNRFIMQRAI